VYPPLATALLIIFPVILAGLTHIAVIRLGAFRTLASLPLDMGLAFRGRRLFGENKTMRGAAVMIAATALWVFIQNLLLIHHSWYTILMPSSLKISPLCWGALAGAGYVAGELPNSFVKRRLDISPGGAAQGGLWLVFWTVDQVDSVIGVLVFLYPVWHPNLPVVLCLFGVTLLVHPMVALVMFCLGLKDRVG
jgi:CDP-archaeol synthase